MIYNVYLQSLTYTSSNTSIDVWWEGFHDSDSGIKSCEVSLWANTSCDEQHAQETVLVPWIRLDNTYTAYSFISLDLQVGIYGSYSNSFSMAFVCRGFRLVLNLVMVMLYVICHSSLYNLYL
jgi:hypothetical protein